MTRKEYHDASDMADPMQAQPTFDAEALLKRLPLTAALEVLPESVGIYDQAGRLIYINTAARKLLGSHATADFMVRPFTQRVEESAPRDATGTPLPPEEWHVTRLLRGETISSERPLVMSFTNTDGSERAISITGAPITGADGAVWGAMVTARDVSDHIQREREQAELLEREREARAISKRTTDELERLQNALDTALMRLSLDDLLKELLDRASSALSTDTATLLLADARGEYLTVRASHGLAPNVAMNVRVPIGQGFAGDIAVTRRPQTLFDTKHANVVSLYMSEQLSSVLGAPLLVGDRLLGVLHVGSASPRRFTPSDVWLLQQIAERAALAIDRAQLYEALQRSHQQASEQARKLDAIIESLSEGIILYGPDHSTLHANSAYRRLFGLAPDSDRLQGDFFERGHAVAPRDLAGDPLPEDQWPASRVLRGETLTGEQSQDIWLRSYDGRDALYNATGGPVYDDAGAFIGAVMALRDITAQRRLERDAMAHAAELEAIIETMVDGLFVHDMDGAIIRVNSSGRQHLGLDVDVSPKQEETPGAGVITTTDLERKLTFYDSQGRVETSSARWPVARVLRGESLTGAQAVELIVRLPDGRERLLNISGAPMRNAEGRLLGAVMLTRDVTGLHALERRTQESLEALLEMAESVVSVTALSGEGVSVKHVGKRLIELARRVLGCQRMAIIITDRDTGVMRPLAVAGLKPNQERQWWAEQAAIEQRGERLEDGPDPQLVQRLKSGEPVMIDMQKPPYRDQPNRYGIQTMLVSPMLIAEQFVGFLSLDYGGDAHEFTTAELNLASAVSKLAALVIERDHMLRAQAATEARALALAEANHRMDEFLGIAAHELRTPITVIKANLQMLLRRAAVVAARAKAGERVVISPDHAYRDADLLSRTEKSLTRLTRLVDDLLDVSRVRAGKLEMRIERADLAAITRDVVDDQRLATPDRVIELNMPDNEPAPVMADPERVGQVITNYLTNALKYSSASTRVRVQMWREGTMVYVSVTDKGPGIPPDKLEQVWELFHRIPGIEVLSGSGIGLGLGLHLCKTIIERQGGRVGVTSRVGDGSSFWFGLPLLTDEKAEEQDD